MSAAMEGWGGRVDLPDQQLQVYVITPASGKVVDDIPAGRLAQPELATISFDLDVICARLMLAVTKSLGSTLAGAPGPASELRLHPRASLGDGGG